MWEEGENGRGRELLWLPPGIKSRWTLLDLWHKHTIFFWCCHAFHWVFYWYPLILSVRADTTISYPVWATFWFRDESHGGTLKCTAPVPSGPWVNNDSGHSTPRKQHPRPLLQWHRNNRLDPDWVWVIGMQGVVGGVAYVTKPRQLSYLSLPSQTLLHGKLLHREMNVKDWIWKKVSLS